MAIAKFFALHANEKTNSFSTNLAQNNIPMVLTKLNINNREMTRTESIKFLGVFLNEMLSWKPRIKCIENKMAKNIGLLFKARPS